MHKILLLTITVLLTTSCITLKIAKQDVITIPKKHKIEKKDNLVELIYNF